MKTVETRSLLIDLPLMIDISYDLINVFMICKKEV